MDKIVNLQISFFGSFINIKPKTDIVIKLLTALKDEEFVPGSADLANVDITTGKIVVDSRMQMISPDKTWTIAFLPDRIDFNYNYQKDARAYKNIMPLLDYAKRLVEKVFGVFASTTGNRLAVNCRFAMENMTDVEMMSFCSRYTKPLSVYKGGSYAEWSVRFNSRTNLKVSESEVEECNRLVELAQVESSDLSGNSTEMLHNIVALIDVNTAANNPTLRFGHNNLNFFINEAAEFIKEVTKEIEEK